MFRLRTSGEQRKDCSKKRFKPWRGETDHSHVQARQTGSSDCQRDPHGIAYNTRCIPRHARWRRLEINPTTSRKASMANLSVVFAGTFQAHPRLKAHLSRGSPIR